MFSKHKDTETEIILPERKKMIEEIYEQGFSELQQYIKLYNKQIQSSRETREKD